MSDYLIGRMTRAKEALIKVKFRCKGTGLRGDGFQVNFEQTHCMFCGAERESRAHVVLDCDHYTELREVSD